MSDKDGLADLILGIFFGAGVGFCVIALAFVVLWTILPDIAPCQLAMVEGRRSCRICPLEGVVARGPIVRPCALGQMTLVLLPRSLMKFCDEPEYFGCTMVQSTASLDTSILMPEFWQTDGTTTELRFPSSLNPTALSEYAEHPLMATS